MILEVFMPGQTAHQVGVVDIGLYVNIPAHVILTDHCFGFGEFAINDNTVIRLDC